jgi:hypothetical protein
MNTQLIVEISIVAALAVAFILLVAWEIKKKGLREFVIDVILEAEEKFEQGRNSDKMEYVIKSLKATLCTTKIGTIAAMFLTDESIEKFIQGIFDSIKKALDYTPNK